MQLLKPQHLSFLQGLAICHYKHCCHTAADAWYCLQSHLQPAAAHLADSRASWLIPKAAAMHIHTSMRLNSPRCSNCCKRCDMNRQLHNSRQPDTSTPTCCRDLQRSKGSMHARCKDQRKDNSGWARICNCCCGMLKTESEPLVQQAQDEEGGPHSERPLIPRLHSVRVELMRGLSGMLSAVVPAHLGHNIIIIGCDNKVQMTLVVVSQQTHLQHE